MTGLPGPATSRGPIAVLVVVTVAWRAVLAARTPVPSGDGTSYLWIAQQFAAGRWSLGLSEVFPPGFPLLLAPWLVLGADPWGTGLGVCLAAAGLTVWPLVRIADHLRPGAGVPAGVLWASSSLLSRNAAEVFSEPPFLLAIACGTLCALRAQWWRAGLWSAAAFWIRPEGALLAASFAVVARRHAIGLCAPLAAGVFGLGWLRWGHGHGFDPLPMLLFHLHERDDLPARGDVLANLLQVPAAWAEAFGPVGFLPLLAMLPTLRAPRSAAALWWQIGLQIAVVCTFVTRRRFLLSAAVPVIALAAVPVAALAARWRRALLAALVAWGVVGALQGVTDGDRLAERGLGEHLAGVLRPEEDFVTDLTRVRWFAGRRPLWPRHRTAAELLAAAAPEHVRWVVLRERSRECDEVLRGLAPAFARAELPPELAAMVRDRAIAVFVRR